MSLYSGLNDLDLMQKRLSMASEDNVCREYVLSDCGGYIFQI